VGKLNRFARGGLYGRYFEGRANLSVDTPFTVVELSDIKSQRGLESVILQMVIFLGSELMFKTPRSLRVAIMIDEAWDLLKGDGTARFIEGIVRRARKYTGALITGTQSIDDYTANPASKVCLENSDFTVFLAQRPETVDRLGVPDAVKEKLKSLVSVPGEFSELAIKAPEGFAFGRLVLDPFSLAVFSSKGATVERLRHYREAEGMDVVTALRTMVARGEAL
jgi:conjugal transfer ATP-binding protein TraC